MSASPSSPSPAGPAAAPNLFGFTASEARIVFGTSAVYALRMLGVYMAMPVLSPHAAALPGATPIWVGLSLGAYGLTQAIFQVPIGSFADRYGRGRALALGLFLFGFGAFVCARASTAPMLALGRLLQGAGAMASTMIALIGDRTREGVRTRAMAAMGVLLGGGFAVGLIGGPVLAGHFGVPALFGFSAVTSGLGLLALPWVLRQPTGSPAAPAHGAVPNLSVREAVRVLAHAPLVALDLGILLLHLGLTALFVFVPLRLQGFVATTDLWKVYAPAIGVGFLAMWIASHVAETRRGARVVLAAGSVLVAGAFVLFGMGGGIVAHAAAIAIYVIGFACLEPVLAAQVTRHADTFVRGTAAGIFNSVQFFGVFLGGLLAGAALGGGEAWLCGALALGQLVWLAAAWGALAVAAGHGGSSARPR